MAKLEGTAFDSRFLFADHLPLQLSKKHTGVLNVAYLVRISLSTPMTIPRQAATSSVLAKASSFINSLIWMFSSEHTAALIFRLGPSSMRAATILSNFASISFQVNGRAGAPGKSEISWVNDVPVVRHYSVGYADSVGADFLGFTS